MSNARTHRSLWLCAALLVFASCGSDPATGPSGPTTNTLGGVSPYPEALTMGQSVRTVVIHSEVRPGDAAFPRCGYSWLIFDVQRPSMNPAIATGASGDCKLYAAPPESDYNASQRWVCAGVLEVDSGSSLMQGTGFCPGAGDTPAWEGNFHGCGALYNDRTASLSSMSELPEDAVTDLSATVRMPQRPAITAPTSSVTTWPTTGDVVAEWTVTDATSVVVRVAADAATPTGPVILCSPRVNGRMVIDAALLDRGGFRAMTARMHVWAYRDDITQAQGRAWRITGASGASVLLQPGR